MSDPELDRLRSLYRDYLAGVSRAEIRRFLKALLLAFAVSVLGYVLIFSFTGGF